MGDFDKYTNYNKLAGIASVKIGFKKPVLETEFNEMQEIARERVRRLIREHLGEGIFGKGNMTYDAGVFTIEDESIVIDGEILVISSLSLSVSNGEDIYLDVWDKEIDVVATMKKEGNEQETDTIENYLLDSRIGVETSRRMVVAFDLSKVNTDPTHRYLKLGSITEGAFVKSVGYVNATLYIGDTPPENPSITKVWLDTSS